MSKFEVSLQYSPHDNVVVEGDVSSLRRFLEVVQAAIESPLRPVEMDLAQRYVAVMCVPDANKAVLEQLRQPATGTRQEKDEYSPRQFAEMVSSGTLPRRGFAWRLLRITLQQITPMETAHFDHDESTLWVIGTEFALRRVAATVRDAIATGRAEAELSDWTQEFYFLDVTRTD